MSPKTIAAVVLVALMGVLWARVLLRSKAGPASANAATTTAVEEVQQQNPKSQIQIQAIPLATVPGRHDTIAADFFKADRSSASGGNQERGNQRILDELGKAVVLEAIIRNAQGRAEKAYLNGAVVIVGSTLKVQMQNDTYIIRVEAIEPAAVRLGWRDRTFKLKMPE
ncbi:MAG: hypothetical protein FJ263_05115 [Planctomycetes bacterium]|nr:hypothetical protein [Planctomycetota bacterium]